MEAEYNKLTVTPLEGGGGTAPNPVNCICKCSFENSLKYWAKVFESWTALCNILDFVTLKNNQICIRVKQMTDISLTLWEVGNPRIRGTQQSSGGGLELKRRWTTWNSQRFDVTLFYHGWIHELSFWGLEQKNAVPWVLTKMPVLK